MAIKGKEMRKDVATELDQSFGMMDQVMMESGFKIIVKVTVYTDKNQARNIEVNGKMMFVMAKVNGLMQPEM